jgi:SAM-dependent methyltransferase
MGKAGTDLSHRDLYATRFSDADARRKDVVWREIAQWLAPYVQEPVLDVGCDRGHFIRNVTGERWAADVRDVGHLLDGIRFVQSDGLALDKVLPLAYYSTVFMSNYLEHLRSRDDVSAQLMVAQRLLRPGGRLIVLQPNIRLVGAAYWDFIDHHVALTEHSLVEAATNAGFVTERLIVRFLPYTTKGRLPGLPWLVRLYLRSPVLWRWFAGQTLYIGVAGGDQPGA